MYIFIVHTLTGYILLARFVFYFSSILQSSSVQQLLLSLTTINTRTWKIQCMMQVENHTYCGCDSVINQKGGASRCDVDKKYVHTYICMLSFILGYQKKYFILFSLSETVERRVKVKFNICKQVFDFELTFLFMLFINIKI